MKTISFSFLFLLSLVLSGQNVYENSEYGFKIKFPDNWIVKKSGQETTIIKAVNSSPSYISYISVAAYPIPKRDIEYYKNASPQEMFRSLKEEYQNLKVELIDSGLKLIDGKRAIWTKVRIYLTETKYIITSNYHLINAGYLYRITNATDGGERMFNELYPIFEKTSNSLVFNK